jgi:two-component system chemotaxis response regulator CheB
VTPLIRVLVIDGCVFSRRAITRMLSASPLVEVVGAAADGEEALRKTHELEPDLITLDLQMPNMDGFTFLRLVMSQRPTPVMVIGSGGADAEVFKALELGAVDFLSRPSPRTASRLDAIERELIRKVHAMHALRIDKVSERIAASPPLMLEPGTGEPSRVAVIGSSTGGPAALMRIFGAFAEAPPCAFAIAQHMPEGFTRGFAARLDRLTPLRAVEARGGERLCPGEILVAPGGRHLELELEGGFAVARIVAPAAGEKYAPSVDRLFRSAAGLFGANLVAVVLTGMGDDGRRGALAVKAAGGSVIAESEQTAVIFGMPKQAIRAGGVDRVLPLHAIAKAIQGGAVGGASAAAGECA